mmetsp:Transcript_16930/g.45555  ORF Transcript_16930/g.45555 Transcript_16930/m.45555 type:complete len:81 (-) Transcript_16930:7-249(-)
MWDLVRAVVSEAIRGTAKPAVGDDARSTAMYGNSWRMRVAAMDGEEDNPQKCSKDQWRSGGGGRDERRTAGMPGCLSECA